MRRDHGLPLGPVPADALHVCVDMQRLFSQGYPWALEWFGRILPQVEALCAHAPAQTVFTRFIPAQRPGEGRGAWARYYERWADVTLERLDPEALALAPPLQRFVPSAVIADKRVYSPWVDSPLARIVAARGADALVVSGGETDICVMATVIGAVDRGYRVIVVADALCSCSDASHDAMLAMFARRFAVQVEVCDAQTLLAAWPRRG